MFGGLRGGRGGPALFGGGRRRPNAMIFLLVMQIMQIGLEHIPPVTLTSVGICIAAYLEVLPAFRSGQVCFTIVPLLQRPSFALGLKSLKLGLMSQVSHVSDYHLYYNALSWLYKARIEERRKGSEWFFLWLILAMLGTVLTYAVMAVAIVTWTEPEMFGMFADWLDPRECVAGLSGVVFALKAYQQLRANPQGGQEGGDGGDFLAPFMALLPPFMRHSVWLEILWIELIAPQVSFLAHVSGALFGVAMAYADAERLLAGPAQTLQRLRQSLTAPMARRR